ncbi:MAG: hypothetical protein JNK12_09495 [Acidimicrobiales bacterium]|nr:hypothetical protein [Acidimicrobiales bacterium]
MRRAVVFLLALGAAVGLGLASACAGGAAPAGPAAAATAPVSEVAPEAAAPAARLPAGQDLYRPPASLVEAGPAGSLIWYQGIVSPVAGSRAWRVVYRSRGLEGEPVAVSGLLIRPGGPAPAGGFPVVSWAIGTPGIADVCAPSRYPPVVPRLARLLRAGFAVVATDGQGLGTRGPSHYLIGESEAHALLDAARAAGGIPGLPVARRVGLWGYSSGGHGVLAAAEAAAEYAPELEILGTAAVSPVVDVERFIAPVDDHPGFTFITVGAWAKVHGIDTRSIFTPRAQERVPRLRTECALTLAFDWPLWRRVDLLRHDLRTTSPWRELMADERAGEDPVEGPLLVIHGLHDSIVVPGPSLSLVRRQCRAGVAVTWSPIAGEDHFIADTTGAQVVDWLAARAAGVPASSTCA